MGEAEIKIETKENEWVYTIFIGWKEKDGRLKGTSMGVTKLELKMSDKPGMNVAKALRRAAQSIEDFYRSGIDK